MPFKALIAYADVPAARRAMTEIRDVLAARGRSFQFCPMLWRFDQLGGASWSEAALNDAIAADIVVLASTESGAMSANLERWVSALLGRKEGRPMTIVAVLGQTEAWTISLEGPLAKGVAPAAKPLPAADLQTAVAVAAPCAA